MTADEFTVVFRALLSKDEVQFESVTGAVLASVVPSVTDALMHSLEETLETSPLLATVGLDVGLTVAIDNPAELGADLFANAVAGWGRYGSACAVVDFGTALSVTAVDCGGRIRGVSIAPGLNAALASLVGNTAQLPTVPLVRPDAVIGTNTIHSIQSGLMHGYRGLVRSLVEGVAQELGGEVNVVATGGQATVLQCDCFDAVDPWLTLDGLRRIYRARSPEGGAGR
jgi:type III pantothenate kinase